jgi:hypothetical protein
MQVSGAKRWARVLLIAPIADSLLIAVVGLNLLWPTSAALRANGAPLNHWIEFTFASMFLGWLGLALSFAMVRRINPSVVPPRRFAIVDRRLAALALVPGVLLLIVRILAPVQDGISACYTTPEPPDVSCLFLADGWAPTIAGAVPPLSRIEEQVQFDPEQGHPWRLGAFNDLRFNIYGSKPGDEIGARRESFRQNAAHPFEVSFKLDATTAARLAELFPSGAQLHIDYRGEATVIAGESRRNLRFSGGGRERMIELSAVELRSLSLRYANYFCPDANCRGQLTMDPLPFARAAFSVSLSPPGAPSATAVPLGNELLAQRSASRLTSPHWARGIETVFALVVLTRLGIWMGRIALAGRPSPPLILTGVVPAIVITLGSTIGDRSLVLEGPPLVLMTLPVVLGVAGVVVALALRRLIPMVALAPAMLVLASAALLMRLPMVLATATSMAPPARIKLSGEMSLVTDQWALLRRDDLALLKVSGDPLTYASWAKDLLASPRHFIDPTVVLSKPFFMYLRAVRYALLGDGEVYAFAQSRSAIWWVVAVGAVFSLSALGTMCEASADRDMRRRVGIGALALLGAVSWILLSHSVMTDLDFFLQLPEGPAATPALLSFGLLLAARGRSNPFYVAAGAAFAISLLYRTANLPLSLLGVATVWLPTGARVSSQIRSTAAYLGPIGLAVAAIWVHAGAPLGIPPDVAAYVSSNTGVPQAPPGSYLLGLVPNTSTLLITASALCTVLIALALPGTKSARVRIGVLGLAVILVLVPLLPQRAAYYYPRSLLTAYYAIAYVPIVLLTYQRRSWAVHERRADETGNWIPPGGIGKVGSTDCPI